MLFPENEGLNRVWESVAEAVTENRLGCSAKVGTNDGNPRPRVICVYTTDFRDEQDVLRVLKELFNMGLVKKSGRPIHYKIDAYTLLDIDSQTANKYSLQASFYSSPQMLRSANTRFKSSTPQKKQSMLRNWRN